MQDDGNVDTVCRTCSFRPWASTGEVATATVTVVRAGGGVDLVPASLVDGRWVADAAVGDGDAAFVDRGGVVDSYGEINGTATPSVGSGTVAAGAEVAGGATGAPAPGDMTTTRQTATVRGVPVAAVATASSLLGIVALALLIVNRKRVVG